MSENTDPTGPEFQPKKGRKGLKNATMLTPPVEPVELIEPEAPDFLPQPPTPIKPQIAFEPDTDEVTARSVFADLDALRVDDEDLADEEDLSAPDILFRKPKRTKYFRTHPDWSLNALLLEYEDEGPP